MAEYTHKYPVGAKVKVVRLDRQHKARFLGTIFTIRNYDPNGAGAFDEPHYGMEDNGEGNPYIWLESELELVEPEYVKPILLIDDIIPEPQYDNSCWYCRKGGLVDLYLDGAMGICPNCKRVCNAQSNVLPTFKPTKKPVKSNKALTTDELKELDGWVVWCSSMEAGKERFEHLDYCGWYRVDCKKEEVICELNECNRYNFKCNNDPWGFKAYLEKPEIPEP